MPLNVSDNDIPGGLPKDLWREVVKAIEDAIPLYDNINDLISFGRAQKARMYAVQNLALAEGARSSGWRHWPRRNLKARVINAQFGPIGRVGRFGEATQGHEAELGIQLEPDA